MLTLTHNQQIRVQGFKHEAKITVFTIPGYCREENIVNNFPKSNPSTLKEATMISANYPGKAEKTAIDHDAFINAEKIKDGEWVRIENKTYQVKVVGEGYCDPVHFISYEN